MHHAWRLIAAGAVLVGTGTVLGLILFRKNGFFELTLPELTIWSFVVGSMAAAFLGLLFVEMKRPPAKQRTRAFLFGLFGAICGLIAGAVYGVFGIREVCVSGGIDPECGWAVLGMMVRLFWPTFGVLVTIGALLGASVGVAAALLTRGRKLQVKAEPVA